jgi:hypothetical protein
VLLHIAYRSLVLALGVVDQGRGGMLESAGHITSQAWGAETARGAPSSQGDAVQAAEAKKKITHKTLQLS